MTGADEESLNRDTYAKHVVEFRLLDHFGGLYFVRMKGGKCNDVTGISRGCRGWLEPDDGVDRVAGGAGGLETSELLRAGLNQ